MDSEYILKQFEGIEQKVERLIEVLKTLEAENTELKEKVELLELELQEKTETENQHSEEKALIKTKIDSLMAKFDEIIDK